MLRVEVLAAAKVAAATEAKNAGRISPPGADPWGTELFSEAT
jgi:hypothetical protein